MNVIYHLRVYYNKVKTFAKNQSINKKNYLLMVYYTVCGYLIILD